jgi:hypothetical protein
VSDETYLGDGLYASFDGWYIKLRAPRYECDHWIALEPAVLSAFDDYRRNLVRRMHQMSRPEGVANQGEGSNMSPDENEVEKVDAPAAEPAPAEEAKPAEAPAEKPAEEPKAE